MPRLAFADSEKDLNRQKCGIYELCVGWYGFKCQYRWKENLDNCCHFISLLFVVVSSIFGNSLSSVICEKETK